MEELPDILLDHFGFGVTLLRREFGDYRVALATGHESSVLSIVAWNEQGSFVKQFQSTEVGELVIFPNRFIGGRAPQVTGPVTLRLESDSGGVITERIKEDYWLLKIPTEYGFELMFQGINGNGLPGNCRLPPWEEPRAHPVQSRMGAGLGRTGPSKRARGWLSYGPSQRKRA